jgi:hypothetical protein
MFYQEIFTLNVIVYFEKLICDSLSQNDINKLN